MDLFITLTIRIKVSLKRLRPGAGRLMYLVVPAEHLLLQSALVDYGDKLPLGIFDMPTDLATGNYKLMQMSFDVPSVKSSVIMPEYKFKTTPSAQSLAMLRSLKRPSKYWPVYTMMLSFIRILVKEYRPTKRRLRDRGREPTRGRFLDNLSLRRTLYLVKMDEDCFRRFENCSTLLALSL